MVRSILSSTKGSPVSTSLILRSYIYLYIFNLFVLFIHFSLNEFSLWIEAHAVHNLSVKVELADIQLEWNEPICPLRSSATGAFYSLIVFETNTQQNAYNIQIEFWCIKGISRRRLTFNKNSTYGCPGMGEAGRFRSALKSCINYSINLVHPEKRNDASLKRFGSLPFVLQSLESRGKKHHYDYWLWDFKTWLLSWKKSKILKLLTFRQMDFKSNGKFPFAAKMWKT